MCRTIFPTTCSSSILRWAAVTSLKEKTWTRSGRVLVPIAPFSFSNASFDIAPSNAETGWPLKCGLGSTPFERQSALSAPVLRFSELRRAVSGISQKMLIQQLRDLEKDGVVHRKVYPEVPPKVEYRLTEDGVALRPALKALKFWAESRKIPSSVKKKPTS